MIKMTRLAQHGPPSLFVAGITGHGYDRGDTPRIGEARLNSEPPAHEALPAPGAATATAAGQSWTRHEIIIGSSLVVLVVALFLPWFRETVRLGRLTLSGTGDGPTAHGYLWIVLLLDVVALGLIVTRNVIDSLSGNLPNAGQMLVGATGLALLLSLLGLVVKPSGYSSSSASAAVRFIVTISWSYGGFVAVLAAAVAFVVALISAGPLHKASRATRAASPPGPGG